MIVASQHLLKRKDLTKLVSGEASGIVEISKRQHSEISGLAEEIAPEELTLRRCAVERVLIDLLQKTITSEQAQLWASFVRRGYISAESGPIRAILIPYETEHEADISDAVSRLDELGDLCDGILDDAEILRLIEMLRTKVD